MRLGNPGASVRTCFPWATVEDGNHRYQEEPGRNVPADDAEGDREPDAEQVILQQAGQLAGFPRGTRELEEGCRDGEREFLVFQSNTSATSCRSKPTSATSTG